MQRVTQGREERLKTKETEEGTKKRKIKDRIKEDTNYEKGRKERKKRMKEKEERDSSRLKKMRKKRRKGKEKIG